MPPLAIPGDEIGAGPVVEAPTLAKGFQQFGLCAMPRDRPGECLRRTMCEMRLRVVTIAKDARGIARGADRVEEKH